MSPPVPSPRRTPRPPLRQYGIGVAAGLAAILLREALDGILQYRAPYALAFPAVGLAAVFGGFGPGLVCLALCGAASLYLWTDPPRSVGFTDPANALAFAIFLAVGLSILMLGRAQRVARGRAYQAGRATLESERRARDILDSVSDGFCTLDRSGRYLYLNAAAQPHLRVPRAELVGRQAWEGFDDAVRAALEERCSARLGPDAVHFEARSPATGRWLEVSAYPSKEGLSVYFRDVTERKLAERERAVLHTRERLARERAVRLQRVTESFSRALTLREVADVGIRLGLEALSAPAGAFFATGDDGSGLELLEASRTRLNDRGSEPVPPGAVRLAAEALGSAGPVFVESVEDWRLRVPEVPADTEAGSVAAAPLIMEGRALGCLVFAFGEWRPVAGEEREFLGALAHQCTQAADRARLFDEHERARTEAESANRLKDEFLATVSHELRTPLHAIAGWIRVLRESPRDEALSARALDLIQENARAQERLIADILDVSRIVTGRLSMEVRPVDPAGAVEAAVEAVRPAAEAKGVRIQAAFESGSALVVGDPDRLRQVAWNLLFNAVKFTGEGGTVDVRLAREGSQVELSVRDTGEGIDPDFLPHVFDRFRQADSSSRRRHGGVGLGLSLVRHLVEMHGGTARAESAGPGQGATFTVHLPVTHAAPPAAPAAPEPAGETVLILAGCKVLLVDDEPDGREGLALYLKHRGAAVFCAGTAHEALATLRRDRPDVIIADIAIPGEDGFALIERVRALPADQGGTVPAVAMTGYSRDEDRVAALEAGFDAFAVKPVDPSDLAGLLSRLAGNDPALPSARGTSDRES